MKKGSQCEKIALALREGRSLTMLDIYFLCSSLNGHKRIQDLRDRGFQIAEGWKIVEHNGVSRKLRFWCLVGQTQARAA